jgi:hypothetical protein
MNHPAAWSHLVKGPHAILLAATTSLLTACGGGATQTYAIAGSVTGLVAGQQLVLSNNGTDNLTIASNAAFVFSTRLARSGSYAVAVASQPARQICRVANGAGSGLSMEVSNVSVTCATAPAYSFDAVQKFQSGQAVKAVLIGNSIGCGYYTIGWENLIPDSNGKLTAYSRIDASVRSAAIQLREKLLAANTHSDLINLSGSGWDTSDHLGTGRFPGVDTIADAIRLSPDVVFLPLQVNDFLLHRRNFAAFQSNTRTMVQRFLDAGILPVLVKENFLLESVAGLDFETYIHEVDAISVEKAIPVIDTYTAFRDVMTSSPSNVSDKNIYNDNVHPNGPGHTLIFHQYRKFFDDKP